MTFLSSVTILCSAVKSQEHPNMNYYCNKSILAQKVELLIVEEPSNLLISSLRQQAMFCIMEMSNVKPKFPTLQRIKLIKSGINSLFSLPPGMETDTNREIVSLYSQTVRALDEMLQGLMTETENPSMLVFTEIVKVIMPWILSEKSFEKARALSIISRQLRFISSFPQLRHMDDFKIGGKLMGIVGLFCMDSDFDVSSQASESLHYCFKVFVNQRYLNLKSDEERCKLLINLQKDFHAEWSINLLYIVMFFRTFLNPAERTDIITLCVDALTIGSKFNTLSAVGMLEKIMKEPFPELNEVPGLIQTIHSHLSSIKDTGAMTVIQNLLQKLAWKYPDEVMLKLVDIQDKEQDREMWKILAASPKGIAMILSVLLKRMKSFNFLEPAELLKSLKINPLLASRALNALLLESNSKLNVETLYPWLYMALLTLISFLVFEGGIKNLHNLPGVPEWLNPVSHSIECLKTLICSAGYDYQVSFLQNHRTWELLTDPEGYLEGISLIAKSMTIRNFWHIRPIVSLIFHILYGHEDGSSVTALAVLAELFQSAEVAAMVDENIIEFLISTIKKNDPVTQKLVLKSAGNLGVHKNTGKFLRSLQPYVLNSCFSTNSVIVTEAFLALRCIICNLNWTDSIILLIEISCILRPFFDDDSEEHRYNSIDMFGILLSKVKRRFLMVSFRYQIHCSLIPLLFHLQDESSSVASASRDSLFLCAKILVCPKFKSVCAGEDTFIIGRTLLEEQKDKISWFLSQSLSYYSSSQASIRQIAVWLTSQIIQIKDLEYDEEYKEVSSALRRMKKDEDPAVACLAAQTIWILRSRRLHRGKIRRVVWCF
ncbi:maestro heat-like repeat-containing protein family member 7 isoform X2 [Monodelphis domestica]|uniref:maestro heat-like repeat-containing protein family member 7 isoform X2 n=1 Tax=Monodelphis domestica TaxID=13616 RepID=UPI0004436462|nr:maestro heat-like repeat-containing protein family member 7 isoform X2 [Monodelphis domestica]